MADYPNILADTIALAEGVEQMAKFMERELEIWADDPNSKHFDPDWMVSLEHPDARKIAGNLRALHGFLWHLASEADAAKALADAHAINQNA